MPSITEGIDAGINGLVAYRAYPRFVTQDPRTEEVTMLPTCRVIEWLAGAWC